MKSDDKNPWCFVRNYQFSEFFFFFHFSQYGSRVFHTPNYLPCILFSSSFYRCNWFFYYWHTTIHTTCHHFMAHLVTINPYLALPFSMVGGVGSGLWGFLPQPRADSIPTGYNCTHVGQQQCKNGPSKFCSVLIKTQGSGLPPTPPPI